MIVIDMQSKIHTSLELFIEASVQKIWDIQTGIDAWSSWQPSVLSARLAQSGPLRAGSQFEWTTPAPAIRLNSADVLHINSTVLELDELKRIVWSGPAKASAVSIDEGIHVWAFTAADAGTLVHTEESWRGALVESDVELSTAMLRTGLSAWLLNLKQAAEGAKNECHQSQRNQILQGSFAGNIGCLSCCRDGTGAVRFPRCSADSVYPGGNSDESRSSAAHALGDCCDRFLRSAAWHLAATPRPGV